MPPIESNKQTLKEADIDIKGLLEQELRARHFECLVKYLEDDNFKETIKTIIDERNERARTTLRVNREHTSVVAQVYRLQKELLNLEKSEIYQAGKWLIDTLSLTGNALIKALLERNLVTVQGGSRKCPT
jgi:16S rRNA C967 or C1407 C5-methylase (RsmB/RsmF family)